MSILNVIIPVRNAIHYTCDCIADLRAQDIDRDVAVWVMNNGSTDSTAAWLAAQHDVKTTHHGSGHGVAESWNLGLRTCFRDGADFVCVVNNDVRLRVDTLRELVAADLPFATGVGVNTPEQLEGEFVRADREHPDFSCYLIRRDCWERVGPFDEWCRSGYVEDALFHARAWRKGIRMTCIGIPFLHYASGTIKANPKDAGAISAQAHENRERFRAMYGCLPGTSQYEALFSEAAFGCES